MTVSNKSIAKAFRNAVPLLWDGLRQYRDGHTIFICVAISRGNGNYRGIYADSATVKAARKVISDRIRNCITLESWLGAQTDVPYHDRHNHCLMQPYRHAWLQVLIKEFETKV